MVFKHVSILEITIVIILQTTNRMSHKTGNNFSETQDCRSLNLTTHLHPVLNVKNTRSCTSTLSTPLNVLLRHICILEYFLGGQTAKRPITNFFRQNLLCTKRATCFVSS